MQMELAVDSDITDDQRILAPRAARQRSSQAQQLHEKVNPLQEFLNFSVCILRRLLCLPSSRQYKMKLTDSLKMQRKR